MTGINGGAMYFHQTSQVLQFFRGGRAGFNRRGGALDVDGGRVGGIGAIAPRSVCPHHRDGQVMSGILHMTGGNICVILRNILIHAVSAVLDGNHTGVASVSLLHRRCGGKETVNQPIGLVGMTGINGGAMYFHQTSQVLQFFRGGRVGSSGRGIRFPNSIKSLCNRTAVITGCCLRNETATSWLTSGFCSGATVCPSYKSVALSGGGYH